MRSLILALTLAAATPLTAQRSGLDVAAGQWRAEDTAATVVSASHYRPLFGPIGLSLGAMYARDGRPTGDRTFTAGLLGLTVGRDGSGPYVMGNAGLAYRSTVGGMEAVWSAGAGYAIRMGRLSVGVEAQYMVTDSARAGFRNLLPTDQQGLLLQARVAFGAGRRRSSTTPDVPLRPARSYSRSEADRITSNVVETALRYMGTPYEWGGTDGNGFDCSGLIQFSYRREGVEIPRVSRDQARFGSSVDRRIAALRPGDVLAFSAEPGGGITHVGLYIGDGEFIHSSSTGVARSRLDAEYWRSRWVNARRMVG